MRYFGALPKLLLSARKVGNMLGCNLQICLNLVPPKNQTRGPQSGVRRLSRCICTHKVTLRSTECSPKNDHLRGRQFVTLHADQLLVSQLRLKVVKYSPSRNQKHKFTDVSATLKPKREKARRPNSLKRPL